MLRAVGAASAHTLPVETLVAKQARYRADQNSMDHPERPEHSPQTPQPQKPLRSVYSNDPEMRELVDFFVEDLTRRVHAMRAALDCFDVARLRALAHQLSGTASGYGFPPIGDAARALENEIPKPSRKTTTQCSGFESDAAQDDGLLDEMMIAHLRERAEDLIALCRRAIPTPEPLPFEQDDQTHTTESHDGRPS